MAEHQQRYKDFINFCKELSDLNFGCKGDIEKLNSIKMKDGNLVKDINAKNAYFGNSFKFN